MTKKFLTWEVLKRIAIQDALVAAIVADRQEQFEPKCGCGCTMCTMFNRPIQGFKVVPK